MKIDKIIDAFNGDTHSKQELKNAYKKAFKLKLILFISLFFILFPIMTYLFSSPLDNDPSVAWTLFFTYFLPTIFAFTISCFTSVFIGNFAMHKFTSHLEITLPDTVAPKIAMRK